MMSILIDKIRLLRLRKKWRENNKHNRTIAANNFNITCCTVGKCTYGALKIVNWNNKQKLRIGNYCSIAQNVTFLLDADHYVNHLSTYPYKRLIVTGELEGVSKGDIIIDDDVWIGYGATILSGVHIGQGAVVAAGAVVSKDVEPYSIVGGVPAKTIKKRFSDDIISFLSDLDYSDLTDEIIRLHIDELYRDISELSLNDLMTVFSWFPRKNKLKEKNI